MAGYLIEGMWDPDNDETFYGEEYYRFLAKVTSLRSGKEGRVSVYLPAKLMTAGEYDELEIPPGTKIMRLVPFTITAGDPSGLPRDAAMTFEDLDVEGVSVRAIPASSPAY